MVPFFAPTPKILPQHSFFCNSYNHQNKFILAEKWRLNLVFVKNKNVFAKLVSHWA